MTDDELLAVCEDFVSKWKCGLWTTRDELVNECFVRCRRNEVSSEEDAKRNCAAAIAMWRYKERRKPPPVEALPDDPSRRWPVHTSTRDFENLICALRAYFVLDGEKMFDHRAKMGGYGPGIFGLKFMCGLTNEQIATLIGKSESAVARKVREMKDFIREFFKEAL